MDAYFCFRLALRQPLETLTFIIRTGQAILVELIDLVNSVIIFVSNDFTQMTNFPTRIPDCDHNHFKKIKATYLLLILNFWYRLFNIKKKWHPKKSLSAIKSKPDLTNDTLICVSSTKLAYNHPFTIPRFYHPSVIPRYSSLAI